VQTAKGKGGFLMRVQHSVFAMATFFVVSFFFVTSAEAVPSQKATFFIGRNEYIVDGKKQQMDAVPFIKDGRAYIPVRYLAYVFGISQKDINWDSRTQSIKLRKGDIDVLWPLKEVEVMWLGEGGKIVSSSKQKGYWYKAEARKWGGSWRDTDVLPLIVSGRAFLPARYLSEVFGWEVSWDSKEQAVTLSRVALEWEEFNLPNWKMGALLHDFTYGDGTYVAVGEGLILYSWDGIHWEQQKIPYGWALSVVYGKGMFIAPGNMTNVWISKDGIHWEERRIETGSPYFSFSLHGITYAEDKGIFVAVGSTGKESVILTSRDGFQWQIFHGPKGSSLSGITYGRGLFVAVGYNYERETPLIMISIDGVNWQMFNPSVTKVWLNDVAFDERSGFVAVGGGGILWSKDGLNWVRKDTSFWNVRETEGGMEDQVWWGVAAHDGIVVASSHTDIITTRNIDSGVWYVNRRFIDEDFRCRIKPRFCNGVFWIVGGGVIMKGTP
jgi:hypothetical protein